MSRVKQLEEQIAGLRNTLIAIDQNCEDESRARTEEEKEQFSNAKAQIDSLSAELKDAKEVEELKAQKAFAEKDAEKVARLVDSSVKTNEGEKDELVEINKKISARKLIMHATGRKRITEGVELEMDQEAREEFIRDAGAMPHEDSINIPSKVMDAAQRMVETRATVTSNIAPVAVGEYVGALREDALWPKLGVTEYTGLTGDYKIPATGKHTVGWATAENSTAGDGGVATTSDTLTPTRVTGFVPISNELFLQNGEVAYQANLAELGAATADLINDAMFPTTSVTNSPGAIAATSGVNTFTEVPTYAAGTVSTDFRKAEEVLAGAEGLKGSLAYVAATNLLSELKSSSQVTSVNPFAQSPNGVFMAPNYGFAIINGYPCYFTSSATKSAGTSGDFLFGNWRQVKMGWFGGMSIIRDTALGVKENITNLVVHRYVDWGVLRGAAFVKATTLIA